MFSSSFVLTILEHIFAAFSHRICLLSTMVIYKAWTINFLTDRVATRKEKITIFLGFAVLGL